MAAAEEAVPLQGERASSPPQPCGPATAGGGARRMPRLRRVLALCTACLALTAAAAGLALWRGTGLAVWSVQKGMSVTRSAAAPDVGQCVARARPPRPPPVAAAEWGYATLAMAMVDSPARGEALAALRAQDAAEALQAARRFACAGGGPSSPPPPAAPVSVDPATYALTPSRLAALFGPPDPASPVAVTWCNAAFVPFALNWAAHARAAGLTPFAVGAADRGALEALVRAGIPAFTMPGASPDASADTGWGTPAFHALGRAKAALAAALTGAGYDALLCDVDTVWLGDPRPFLAGWPGAAVLTSWDGLARTSGEEGHATQPAPPTNASGLGAAVAALSLPRPPDPALEAWPAASAAPANIGVMLWRAPAHPVAVAWRDALLAEPGAWDQDVFNDLLTAGGGGGWAPPAPPGLFRAFGRAAPTAASAFAGVLPVDAFASGHTFFIQRLAERTGARPLVVHATFQFSGSAGKAHRLRERWLWAVDGPEHYAPPTGLLTLGAFEDDPDFGAFLARAPPGPVPANASAAAALAALDGHFALVARQLRTLAAGLALASALNRTLVLPRLWCGADRWWQPFVGGSIPGTAAPARLPFRCPADHVLDLAALGDRGARLDAATYGPPIAFREAGLLDNPRFPAVHKRPGPSGTLAVVVVGGGGEGAGGGAPAPAPATLAIPPGLDDAGLRAALSAASSTPVLHFPDPLSAMTGGFRDAQVGTRFARRLAVSTDLWCCVPGAEPGHVWYDAAAGTPHTDRHGRKWGAGSWVPTPGP